MICHPKPFSIHPISLKLMKKGHPWITADQFSKKFPSSKEYSLVSVCDAKGVPFAICINDSTHKTIKARYWRHYKAKYEKKDFKKDLVDRLDEAFEKRKKTEYNRDNFFLLFGESDRVPGVRVLKLDQHILIQFYCFTMKQLTRDLVEYYAKRTGISAKNIWIQDRSESYEGQSTQYPYHENKAPQKSFIVKELGIKYQVQFGQHYDFGIYTDMANIREQLETEFKDKKVLNLFSYTGAFSAFALNNQANHVTSIDLSSEYLEVLENNLKHNELEENHQSICGDVVKVCKKLVKNDESFDLIICDPPSSFSDGKKRISNLEYYKRNLLTMSKLVAKGGKIILFLNTQKLTRQKFRQTIEKVISSEKIELNVDKQLTMQKDCAILSNFPEGDYLKGIVLTRS